MEVEVFGHPSGRFLVKSKFRKGGISRSLSDLEWALETFHFENPSVGIVGQGCKKYFTRGDSVNFFHEKKIISKMMKFLVDQDNSVRSRNLTSLKLSMTSNLEDSQSFLKSRTMVNAEQSEFLDDSLFCEHGEIPEKR